MVLSSVLEQLKVEGVIDPFATIHSLRQQQPGIVSTFVSCSIQHRDQFLWCPFHLFRSNIGSATKLSWNSLIILTMIYSILKHINFFYSRVLHLYYSIVLPIKFCRFKLFMIRILRG